MPNTIYFNVYSISLALKLIGSRINTIWNTVSGSTAQAPAYVRSPTVGTLSLAMRIIPDLIETLWMHTMCFFFPAHTHFYVLNEYILYNL